MKKVKIVYFFDTLCGWCYGFSPVMTKIYQNYQTQFDFDVISGGLFLNERIGLINEVAPYIKQGAYKQVETTTGVKFGEGFLARLFDDNNSITLDSIYPAMALCIVKEKYPEKAFEFSTLLQKALYFDGIDTIDLSAYAKYAVQIGFNEAEFNTKMKEEVYQIKAQEEFQYSNSLKINGYPALALFTEEKGFLIASGYTPYNEIEQRLSQFLQST